MLKKLKILVKFLFSPKDLISSVNEPNLNFWDAMYKIVNRKRYRKVNKSGNSYYVFVDGSYCFSVKQIIEKQMAALVMHQALKGMRKEFESKGNADYPKVEVVK